MVSKSKRISNYFKSPIKLFWWRLDGSKHGNFGDEITHLLIKKIFNRRVVWASPSECDMIGAGSILVETYQNKQGNKPYVWSSGFIEDDGIKLTDSDFVFKALRGKSSLRRVSHKTGSPIVLGDAGLLASYLLEPGVKKRHKLGILPHYVDKDSELIKKLSTQDGVYIIDATWPCTQVVQAIAECDALLSSSLHGLIVGDSVGTPNKHLILSDKLKGGSYKFIDYYSALESSVYSPLTLEKIQDLNADEVCKLIKSDYRSPANLKEIQQSLIEAFPF
jgi:pyruvyltransferase